MSQVSVNIIDPAAGAQIPMTGGGNAGAVQENARQFNQGQKQQQGQFEVSAQQQQQQLDMQRQQMAEQKKEMEHNRQVGLIEQSMMAKREKLAMERERIADEMRNATMAGDLSILEKNYAELDENDTETDDTDTKLTKLSLLELLKRNTSLGSVGADGQAQPSLIQRDLAEAMEMQMAEDTRRDQEIMETLTQTISGNTEPEDPASGGEGLDVFGGGSAKAFGEMNKELWNKKDSPDPDPKGIGGGVPSTLPRKVIFSDDLVMRVAPQLGMDPGETDVFRGMVQSLENAAMHNAMGSPQSRDAELAKAQEAANQLVLGTPDNPGIEPEKMGLVLKGLTKLGAEGRLGLQHGAQEKNAESMAAGGKADVARVSEKDKAYFSKVEQMGVLGSSLRGPDGKALFRNTTAVRAQKGADGKVVLTKTGVSPADILSEVTADFMDNGKFDQSTKSRYLDQLPAATREKVEKILVNRQMSFQNEIRGQGFDPETFDLGSEMQAAQQKSKDLKKKKGALLNRTTIERAKNRLGAEQEGLKKKQTAEEMLLGPLEEKLNALFNEGGA